MPRASLKRKLLRTSILLLCLALPFAGWRCWTRWLANSQLAAVRRAGLPTNGEELNQWYAAVPEAENAALVLTQAFALRRNYADSRSNLIWDFKLPRRRQALTPEQAELLKGYVELNVAALTKAEEGLKLPRSRYPVDFSFGMQTPLPHLTWLKNLAEVEQYRAELSLMAGDTSETVRAISAIVRLAGTLENEPILISQLVRLRIRQMAVASIERSLNLSLNFTQTTNLTTQITQAAKIQCLARALIGERAGFAPYFRTSPSDDPRIYPPKKDQEEDSGNVLRPKDWGMLKLVGYYDMDLGQFLFVMDKVIPLADLCPPANLEVDVHFAKAAAVSKRKGRNLSALIFSNCVRAAARENKCIAHLRLATIALALEQFRNQNGRLPEKLVELTPAFLAEVPEDPFTGTELLYHRLPKGYVVYSVGHDLVDNGGKEEPIDKKWSYDSGYDITFTVER
jgi:hypothetical protein